MKNAKIVSMLISTSLSILVFSGCNIMQSSNTKGPSSPMKSATNTNKGTTKTQSGKIDPTLSMKNHYASTLKQLVKSKVITQVQSNKVLVALTNNLSQELARTNKNTNASANYGTGTSPGTGTGTPGTGTTTPGTGTTAPGSTTNPNVANESATPSGRTYRNNGLADLVTKGVISKEQADIINAKI